MIDKILQKYKTTHNSHDSNLISQARSSKINNQHDDDLYKEEMDELLLKNEEIMSKYCTLYNDSNTNSKYKIKSLNNDFKNKQISRNNIKNTAGKNWFNMKATEMTPEIENDLKALKLRHIIDPSRFYKKPDSNGLPRFFQMGTIHTELTMGKKYRLKKHEVKATLAEEFLETDYNANYSKRKFREIQDKKISLGRKRKRMNDFKLKSKSKKKDYIKK